MKMKNVAIALFMAVATFSTTAIFSQNENGNDELSISNDQTIMGQSWDPTKVVHGVWVPD